MVTNKADGKHATCHDLRRAFCTRWASKVKPAVLQKLARHSEITTTLRYYADLDAEDIGEELWATYGPKAGDKPAIYNKPYNTCPQEDEIDDGANCPNSLCSKVAEAGFEPARPITGTGF